ncbi:AidA/PixA family protein [Photorhabdus asymbiotica]|uniref:AidA/PixA family protein n=1 Tax=Photorhabdus asymbiotica TaxID=291112 RepID=UPI003DA6F15D
MNDKTSFRKINSIDILVAVDVKSIANDIGKINSKLSQDCKKPTPIDDKYFYYITTQDQQYTPKDNATGKTIITGKVGDSIRWRATSLSAQNNHQVFLYHMKALSNATYTSSPIINKLSSDIYFSKETINPKTVYTPFTAMYISYLETTLLSPGDVQYISYISIYDNNNSLIGYCSHDPLIHII